MRGILAWSVVGVVAATAACPADKGGAAGSGGSVLRLNTPRKGQTLAKVGDAVITVEEFEERVNSQGPFARPRFQDMAKRKEFLDALVRQELLAQEALRRGFGDDPEVQDAVKKVMVQKLTRLEYDSRVKQEDIKADDVKKYYDEHPDEFHKPEMMRCGAIVTRFGDDKAAARKRIDAAVAELQKAPRAEPGKPLMNDPFQDLAGRVSEDPESKSLRGDLKFLSRQEMTDKYGASVAENCFGLKNLGDVSGVVEGKDGWFVLKNTGNRKAIDRTLEQVETQIRNRLFRERRTTAFNDYVESLRKGTAVTVDESKLSAMNFAGPGAPPPGSAPPSVPPSKLPPAEGERAGGEGEDPHAH